MVTVRKLGAEWQKTGNESVYKEQKFLSNHMTLVILQIRELHKTLDQSIFQRCVILTVTDKS